MGKLLFFIIIHSIFKSEVEAGESKRIKKRKNKKMVKIFILL